jgi:uncharacterized protein YegP (UPF0339 family)
MGKMFDIKYQVYKDVGGKYRFRLRAANNKILAVSEAYETKAGCTNGVESVQKNCQSKIEDKTTECKRLPNPKYEIFVDTNLKFRFNLIASNGQIIASSEAYNSKQGCIKGIEAVKNSCGAGIEDLTVNQTTEKIEKQVIGIVDTGIAMLSPPNVVESGSTVTFEGWLIDSKTGKGIEKATINIWERDRSFMGDKVLTSGVTDKEGSFNINWKAKQQDWWDDTVELYAKFKGTENYKPARSANYRIKVLWYAKQKVGVKP